MFTIRTQKPGEKIPKFYIQCKGEHSGRPLKKPIPNCFAVYTEYEHLYSLTYALYVGGLFKILIRGSVIPFITIEDTKAIIHNNIQFHNRKELFSQIEKIESLKEITLKKLKLLEEMKRAYCYEALKLNPIKTKK